MSEPSSKRPLSQAVEILPANPCLHFAGGQGLVYLLVWNTSQATPLCLSLELSLHMWLHPYGSISRSTHSNTTGAWYPEPESSVLSVCVFNNPYAINAAPHRPFTMDILVHKFTHPVSISLQCKELTECCVVCVCIDCCHSFVFFFH